MQSGGQKLQRVALIGFGEAGGILGADLAAQGVDVTAYDILVESEDARATLAERTRMAHVEMCLSLADAIKDSQLIISAVTAAAARDVVGAAAQFIEHGQWFLDINSIAPDTKRANAVVIDKAGGRYVDVAVMAPVPPQRLKVPMLLGGPEVRELASQLQALGFNAKAVADQVGVASAIKMCRSIMIKGLEALTLESMFTARHYGVEAAVLESLHTSFPHMGWNAELPDYLISRIAEHGRRRAAEMREVAVTVKDAKISPTMSGATAQRHESLVDQMKTKGLVYDNGEKFSWRTLADALVHK